MPKAFECETKQINTKDIVVDELGQRDVERRKAQFNKIMRTFDPNLVQPIKVALIDGKYICFDGQMTRKVLIEKNGGKDTMAECKVYYGMTLLDCAIMFVNQTGTVSKVDITDKIRVMANYGFKDEMDFIRVTETNGLNVSWTKSKCKNAVVAVSTLFNEFKSFNDLDAYSKYIRVIRGAWNGDPDGSRAQILKGLGLFLRTYKDAAVEETLIEKLSTKRPVDIIRDAQADRTSGARKYAVQILQAYNFCQREAKRLPNLL